MSRDRVRASVVAVAVALGGVAGVGAPSSQAQGVPVNHDFATEVLGDPWDFSNPGDALLAHGPPVSFNVTNAGFRDGTYQWTSDVGSVDLHPMTVPGALPDSRDGRWNPVDADTYTHVSMRLHASRDQAFRIAWFVCTNDYAGCDRWHDFRVQQGWHTYTLPMRQRSDDWRGMLKGIRLASGEGQTTFRLDWLRIHTAGSSPTPPAGAPAPTVEVPDAEGDEDAARVVVGNPWDFSDPADVVGRANVADTRFANGRFHATNAGPQRDNPSLVLPHGPGIDPDRHHLLTVDTSYDGGFSLGFGPGGGMHGRWLFRRADNGAAWADSRELVTYPSRSRVTYDLRRGRFGPTVEAGSRPWTGSTITGLRWDANEDPGPRRWQVDEIRLAATHEASGIFEVEWSDANHRAGTTVDIGVSRRRGTTSGPTLATDVTQRPGRNRRALDMSDLARGTWWVWVRATAPSGVTSTHTATGPLQVTGRVAGPDRVATGTAVSRLGWSDGADTVVVASARGFPDALAGVQLADAVDGPLLLTEPDRLVPSVAAELRRLRPDEVVVLGGRTAIGGRVIQGIRDELPAAEVGRIAGRDRYDTAARIADEAARRLEAAGAEGADQVMLASGTSFPDALAAGPYLVATRTPLLLTDPERLSDATRQALADRPDADVVVAGGPGALADDVVAATGRDARRIAGPDRYETARRLAAAAVTAGASPARALVASGVSFPDALGAGGLLARTGEVMLLTAPTDVPPPTRRWLARDDVRRALVMGGRVAVADPVVAAIHDRARAD